MRFKTFYEDGRKYAKINGVKILMEPSTKDIIQEMCKRHFKKFKLQYHDNGEIITVMVFVGKKAKTEKFFEEMDILDIPNLKWDIARQLRK